MTVPERWKDDECRDVMSSIPVYVWSALPDGTVDFVNPQWEEYTGLPASAAFGWKWGSVIHPEDVERYTSAWRLSLKSLDPLEQEIRVHGKNGVYRGGSFDVLLLITNPARSLNGMVQVSISMTENVYRKSYNVIMKLFVTISSKNFATRSMRFQYFVERCRLMEMLTSSIVARLNTMASPSEQMIGFNWKNVVHPDDSTQARRSPSRIFSCRAGA